MARYIDFEAMVSRSFRALLISAYGLAIGVPLVTALIVFFGPDPVLRGSKYLAPGVVGLSEIRDRMVVISWWLLVGLAVLLIRRAFTAPYEVPIYIKSDSRWWLTLLVIATILFFLGLVVRMDTAETDNWKRIEAWVLIASSLVYAVGFRLKTSRLLIQSIALLLGVLLLLEGTLTLIQSPATIRDNYHFVFTANELLAPASGLYPIASFQAHYSNLLGFIIAPIVRLLPSHTMSILVGYLLVLQLFCLSGPAFVSRIVGQRRLALAITLPPLVLATAANEIGLAQHTYFQGFPLRSVMPTLLLLALVWIATKLRVTRGLSALTIGGLSGMVVLNNADFGLPAAASAVTVMTLCGSNLSRRMKIFTYTAIGGAISLVGTSLLYAILGKKLDLQLLLLFVRVVSEGGYMNAAMPIGGLPIAMVTGFGIGSALGVYAIGRGCRTSQPQLLGSAVFLLFPSIWGLLSFVYYSGRSFTSTALGGHAYQLGLVVSGVLLYAASDYKHLQEQLNKSGIAGKIFHVIAVAFLSFLVSHALRIPTPTTSAHNVLASGSEHPTLQYYVGEVNLLRQTGVITVNPNDIGLLLPLSNALQQTGVGRSLMFTSHPQFAALMPDFARLQCQAVSDSTFTLLIEDAAQTSILDLPACKSILKDSVQLKHLGDNLRVLRYSLAENSAS